MIRCDINYCEYRAKYNYIIEKHKANIHNINVTWYYCDQENCKYKTKVKYQIKKHKADAHNIGITWYYCDQKNCTTRTKSSSHMKSHKVSKHDIGITWYKCDQLQCNKQFKSNPDLMKHKTHIHNINVIWQYCQQENCNSRFKTIEGLHRHEYNKHNINVTWHYCDIDQCNYKVKTVDNLKKHKANKHNINVTWYCCDQENCDAKFKTNSKVIDHKANIHNIDVIWHNCDQVNCNRQFKNFGGLKRHKENIHDIGNHLCDICTYNRNSSIVWADQYKNKLKICRVCYNKVTGKDSRKELKMSDFLDNITEIKPFLIGSDKSFRSMGGCSYKRPDKLYISKDTAIIVECDEHQHIGNDSYICDEKRISDCFDEFNGQKLIVIRWNPDTYKSSKKLTIEERLIKLKELILEVLINPPEELIFIYYMFYDQDNDLIAKNIPNKLIF